MTHPKNNQNRLGVYQIQFTPAPQSTVIEQPLFLDHKISNNWMDGAANKLLFSLLFSQIQLQSPTQKATK